MLQREQIHLCRSFGDLRVIYTLLTMGNILRTHYDINSINLMNIYQAEANHVIQEANMNYKDAMLEFLEHARISRKF